MRSLSIVTALALAVPAFAAAQDEPIEDDAPVYDMEAAYDDAARYAGSGRIGEALETFREIISHDDMQPDVWYNIGNLSDHQDAYTDCTLAFRRYLVLVPDASDADEVADRIEGCESDMESSGSVTVDAVTPDSATIAIDGVIVSRGPAGTIRLDAGPHTVTATRTDFDDFSTTIDVVADTDTPVTIDMTEIIRFGGIAFDIDEPGATVSLDGVAVGSAPVSDLSRPEGRYLVMVELDGFHPWQRYVEVVRDDVLTVEVRLISADVDLDDL